MLAPGEVALTLQVGGQRPVAHDHEALGAVVVQPAGRRVTLQGREV